MTINLSTMRYHTYLALAVCTLFFITLIPASAQAASLKPACNEAKTDPCTPTGDFNETTLSTISKKPTLTGTASGTNSVRVVIRKEGSSKILFQKKVSVYKGVWKVKVSKKLAFNDYDILLSARAKSRTVVLASSTLSISATPKPKATTITVSSIPLLTGGKAKIGATVPLSYLQVTNTGKAPAVIKGFKIKQNGTASGNAVIGLSTVDDRGASRVAVGGTEGFVVFKDGMALAPSGATLAPGEMRLFTIKGILSLKNTSGIGKNLMIDVIGLDTNATIQNRFPIRGTTWSIGF